MLPPNIIREFLHKEGMAMPGEKCSTLLSILLTNAEDCRTTVLQDYFKRWEICDD